MILHKLQIHFYVMRATVYPFILAVLLIGILWFYNRPDNRLKAMLSRRPALHTGAMAAFFAAFTGYFVNDSGLPVLAVILGISAAVVCFFVPEYKEMKIMSANNNSDTGLNPDS